MSDGEITISAQSGGVWWSPQPRFRWVVPRTRNVPPKLQQASLSNRGDLRWDDVPIVVIEEEGK